jgi:non-ribosomal peptide synthetase component E (peptide arylation enzyme)
MFVDEFPVTAIGKIQKLKLKSEILEKMTNEAPNV